MPEISIEYKLISGGHFWSQFGTITGSEMNAAVYTNPIEAIDMCDALAIAYPEFSKSYPWQVCVSIGEAVSHA